MLVGDEEWLQRADEIREARQGLVVTMRWECWGRREGPPPEDEEEEACLEGVRRLRGQRTWTWPGDHLKQVGHW